MFQLLIFVIGSVFLGIAITLKFLMWLSGSARPEARSGEEGRGVEGCFETFFVMIPLGIAVMLYLVAVVSTG